MVAKRFLVKLEPRIKTAPRSAPLDLKNAIVLF